jgi:single-strand DNA-binding protein
MSKSINVVILSGNLGKEPEIKYTSGGKAVGKLSLAVSSSAKDASGDWVEKTDWHQIVCFEKTAELAQQYLTKGSKISVQGRLSNSSWEDKQTGEKKYRTEIVASDIIFLDSKGESKSTGNTIPAAEDDSSDLPF